MNNMTVVYADAEEKYVKNVILYGKTADNYLYTDSKCSEVNKVDKDTLLNLCKKGVLHAAVLQGRVWRQRIRNLCDCCFRVCFCGDYSVFQGVFR